MPKKKPAKLTREEARMLKQFEKLANKKRKYRPRKLKEDEIIDRMARLFERHETKTRNITPKGLRALKRARKKIEEAPDETGHLNPSDHSAKGDMVQMFIEDGLHSQVKSGDVIIKTKIYNIEELFDIITADYYAQLEKIKTSTGHKPSPTLKFWIEYNHTKGYVMLDLNHTSYSPEEDQYGNPQVNLDVHDHFNTWSNYLK